MFKTQAAQVFECDKSCGHIIEKGEICYIAGAQVICLSCATAAVYGPPPDRTDE